MNSPISLIVEPRKVISWQEFVKSTPGFSIALDGYVKGSPKYSEAGPHLNLNHHEEVDRLATRSTSGQMLMYIKQGLFQKFSQDGRPKANLYVNDPDQDVCLSVWLAQHNERISGVKSEPLISKLIFAEDSLDATAGAYPFPLESDLMQDVAWIFQPYTSQRLNMSSLDASQMETIIESVGARIGKYTTGMGEKLKPDDSMEMLHQGEGWAMFKEIGLFAKSRLFQQGTYAFISYRGENPKDRHRYSYGKMSPFVFFPLEEWYGELNTREGLIGNPDCHGGGNTIGGSPREAGSGIAPEQMAAIYTEFLKKRRE